VTECEEAVSAELEAEMLHDNVETGVVGSADGPGQWAEASHDNNSIHGEGDSSIVNPAMTC